MSMYKKRTGTSGIGGHLYETKLISLILFKLLHDDNIEDFKLASNMDDIGEFDDICLKIKIKGVEKPIKVFVQIKHRDNNNTTVSLESESTKWCKSYTKIKEMFSSGKNDDEIIDGEFNEIDCNFILYTNGKYTCDTIIGTNINTKLNTLLATSDTLGTRLVNTVKTEKEFGEQITKEEINILVKRFVKYFNEDPKISINIMNDEYIARYHVVLAKHIVDVSDIKIETKSNLKHRIITFRSDLRVEDKNIEWFLEVLYDLVLKTNIVKPLETEENVNKMILAFLSKPSALTLSPLIETYITHKNNSLEFIAERVNDKQKLDEIQMSKTVINKAKAIAGKNLLKKFKVTVPIAFGNKDLAIRGSKEKINKRINYLVEKIKDLCENVEISEGFNIVTIDDSIDEGILSFNGGLGGAVGNILIHNEAKNLLKFTNSANLPEGNAKSLLFKLESQLTNIQAYRFNVTTRIFPKLSFDCTDTAKEFLKQLLIFPKQKNQKEVENLLKEMIEEQLRIGPRSILTSDIVYLYYHNEVQKWWMTPKVAPYITKESNIYSQIFHDIETKMGILENTFYVNNIRYFGYTFQETVEEKISNYVNNNMRLRIETDITALTTVKILRYLKYKSVVLDLDLILSLQDDDFSILIKELRKADKIPILICDKIVIKTNLNDRLQALKEVIKSKNIIVITSKPDVVIIHKHFPIEDYTVYEDSNILVDFSDESQKEIIKNAKATFQGSEVNLVTFLKDGEALIKGAVLKKIIDYGHIVIGEALTDATYESIRDLYIHRRITEALDNTNVNKHINRRDQNQIRTFYLKSFHDVEHDVVFLLGKPGMGKSTLLTQISLATKKINNNVWIIRINLLYQSKEFYKWHKNKIHLNTIEILKLLCGIVIKNNEIFIDLKEIDNKIWLVNFKGDENVEFTLNMFLKFFNGGNLIILCDGFDEICPDYKDIVIKMLIVMKTFPQKTKLWVTSRPHREIVSDLIPILGKPLILEYLKETEQRYFMNTYIAKNVGQMPEVQLLFNGKLSLQQDIMNFFSTMYAKTGYRRFAPLEKDQPEYSNMHKINTRLALSLAAFYATTPRDPIPTIFINITEVEKLTLGSPLLLKLLADYLIGLQDDDLDVDLGDMNSIIFMHGIFLDNKLKNMFLEKYKMDIHKPYIKHKYEEERISTHNLHKKLAAHELYGSPLFNKFVNFEEFNDMGPFTEENSKEYDTMIDKVLNNVEIVGIITSVTHDKRPVFIHRTFLEYFAIEFIIDILKNENFLTANKSLLLSVIVKHSFGVVMSIVHKSFWDKQLAVILNEIANPLLLYNNYLKLNKCDNNLMSYDQFERLINSSSDDFEIFNLPGYGEDSNYNVMSDPLRDNMLKSNESIIDKMKPHLRKYFS